MWGRIRSIIFENLGLKIASLLLAFLLYAHVVTDQEREIRRVLGYAASDEIIFDFSSTERLGE